MSSRNRMAAVVVVAALIGAGVGGASVYLWSAAESRAQTGQTVDLRTDLTAARAQASSLREDVAGANVRVSQAAALADGLRHVIADATARQGESRVLTTEPAGDIPAAALRRGATFLARISSISTATGEVTLDVIVDTGRRSPNSDANLYANRRRRTQVIKLQSDYIPVVMPQGQDPEGLHSVSVGGTAVAELDQYAASARSDDGFLNEQIFIVHVDSRGIFELEQVFQV